MPILPHKLGNVRDFWDDVSEKYGEDMVNELKAVGVKRMMAFLQAIPDKGDFLIMHLQSKDSLDKTLDAMFMKGAKCSSKLKDHFLDFTGVDLSKKDNWPQLQLLMDWKDKNQYMEEKNMLKMPWCFTASILPGKTEDVLKLMKDAQTSRMAESEDLLRHHDIIRSLSYLQRTPQGDFIVRHIVASNPLDDLIQSFMACNEKTCQQARKLAEKFTGTDFANPKNQPHVELLFKWDERRGFETADQIIAYTE